jgi:hypothetical protein
MRDRLEEQPVAEEKPPLFANWPRLYAAVAAYLAVLIFLFYIFTVAYQNPQ